MFNDRAKRTAVVIGVLSAVVVAATVVNSLTMPPNSFDDGIQLSAAVFWLRGQVPNVDFYAVYPPLNCYLLGTAFRLLGESIVTYRIVETGAYIVTAGATAWLARQRIRGLWLSIALFGILVLNMASDELQCVTALMWSTLATVLVIEGRARLGHVRGACFAGAGACVAALAFTRLNFALYFGFAFAVDTGMTLASRKVSAEKRRALVDLVHLGVPATVITAGLCLLWGGSLASLVQQIAIMPSKANVAYTITPVSANLLKLPFSFAFGEALVAALPIAWLAIRATDESDQVTARLLWYFTGAVVFCWLCLGRWLPVALLAFVPALVIVVCVAGQRLQGLADDERFLLLLLIAQEHYIFGRPDRLHLLAVFPMIAVLLVLAIAHEGTRSRTRLATVISMVCGTVVAYNTLAVLQGVATRRTALAGLLPMLRSNDDAMFGQCGTECDAFRVDPDELAAVSMIREHAPPGANVYSGFLYNRLGRLNDLRAYWLMRRRAGTRYTMLLNGFTTGRDEELEIVQDLRTRGVDWLLLLTQLRPTASSDDTGSVLDRYIRAGYERTASYGPYEVWRAKAARD